MTAYFDTSAVVRLYVDEADHRSVRAMNSPILTTDVTRIEFCSAVWKKVRTRELEQDVASDADALFVAELADPNSRFALIGVDDQVVHTAREVVRRHGLRAYDAVQLATALLARDLVPELTTFVTFDRGLRAAAAAEGFAVAPDLT